MNETDIEILAVWLHAAARREGHLELFRRIIRLAAQDAAEMYADEDDFDVRSMIGRFAAEFDELERQHRQDEADEGERTSLPAVVRGNGVSYPDGTERVHIHILRQNAVCLQFRDGAREPICLVVDGRRYQTHLQSRAGYPYVWVCPDMLDETNSVVRLAHVLRDFGMVRNQRLTLLVLGRELLVQPG